MLDYHADLSSEHVGSTSVSQVQSNGNIDVTMMSGKPEICKETILRADRIIDLRRDLVTRHRLSTQTVKDMVIEQSER